MGITLVKSNLFVLELRTKPISISSPILEIIKILILSGLIKVRVSLLFFIEIILSPGLRSAFAAGKPGITEIITVFTSLGIYPANPSSATTGKPEIKHKKKEERQ